MNIGDFIKPGCIGLVSAVLLACGGGGGSQVAGIGGTGITSSGTITGFGSIFVNGVEYETGGAMITVDDSDGSESDLGLGMVVTVTGTVNDDGLTGTADSVVYDDELQGPIEDEPRDPTADPDGLNGDGTRLQFPVMGILVEANRTATVFDDGAAFDTLAQGDYIEVSGFFDQDGVLHATRIELEDVANGIELKGTAQNADATSFELGSFTVQYDAGTDVSGLTGGVVIDGMQVEVKGSLSGDTITATRIEDDDDGFDDDVDKASVEGIVTDYISDNNFRVSGVQVNAEGATLQPASLVIGNGVEVEVEGPIVGGILNAVSVEVRGGDVELEARVLSASSVANTITLQYFTGMVTVQVDNRTSLKDEFGDDEFLTLAEINPGDFLEIHASLDDAGNIIASEIRRDEINDDILQGPADSCDGSTVTLFGVGFTLNDATSLQNEYEEEIYAGVMQFCDDLITRGLYVKVKDVDPADGIADEAELED